MREIHDNDGMMPLDDRVPYWKDVMIMSDTTILEGSQDEGRMSKWMMECHNGCHIRVRYHQDREICQMDEGMP